MLTACLPDLSRRSFSEGGSFSVGRCRQSLAQLRSGAASRMSAPRKITGDGGESPTCNEVVAESPYLSFSSLRMS